MDYKITSFKFNQTTRIIYFRKIKALNNKILFKNKVKIQIKLIIIPTQINLKILITKVRLEEKFYGLLKFGFSR